jgi:hypothetical protein
MTLTTPCRLMTLHFRHIGLTEALTFISDHHSNKNPVMINLLSQPVKLLEPISNPAPGQIIRGKLHQNIIPW